MSLETIKERADAATPGPWSADGGYAIRGATDDVLVMVDKADVLMEREDAAFIAHARQDIPALLRVAEAAALYRTAMAVALEYGDSNDPHGDRLWDAATSTGDALTRALDDLEALP